MKKAKLYQEGPMDQVLEYEDQLLNILCFVKHNHFDRLFNFISEIKWKTTSSPSEEHNIAVIVSEKVILHGQEEPQFVPLACKIVNTLKESGFDLNEPHMYGWTVARDIVLKKGLRHGFLDKKVFEMYGLDPLSRDSQNNTCFHDMMLSVYEKNLSKDKERMKYILDFCGFNPVFKGNELVSMEKTIPNVENKDGFDFVKLVLNIFSDLDGVEENFCLSIISFFVKTYKKDLGRLDSKGRSVLFYLPRDNDPGTKELKSRVYRLLVNTASEARLIFDHLLRDKEGFNFSDNILLNQLKRQEYFSFEKNNLPYEYSVHCSIAVTPIEVKGLQILEKLLRQNAYGRIVSFSNVFGIDLITRVFPFGYKNGIDLIVDSIHNALGHLQFHEVDQKKSIILRRGFIFLWHVCAESVIEDISDSSAKFASIEKLISVFCKMFKKEQSEGFPGFNRFDEEKVITRFAGSYLKRFIELTGVSLSRRFLENGKERTIFGMFAEENSLLNKDNWFYDLFEKVVDWEKESASPKTEKGSLFNTVCQTLINEANGKKPNSDKARDPQWLYNFLKIFLNRFIDVDESLFRGAVSFVINREEIYGYKRDFSLLGKLKNIQDYFPFRLIVLARRFDEGCLFRKEVLPRDMYKLILSYCGFDEFPKQKEFD